MVLSEIVRTKRATVLVPLRIPAGPPQSQLLGFPIHHRGCETCEKKMEQKRLEGLQGGDLATIDPI